MHNRYRAQLGYRMRRQTARIQFDNMSLDRLYALLMCTPAFVVM